MTKEAALVALEAALVAAIGRLFAVYMQSAAAGEAEAQVNFARGIALCRRISVEAKTIVEQAWE